MILAGVGVYLAAPAFQDTFNNFTRWKVRAAITAVQHSRGKESISFEHLAAPSP